MSTATDARTVFGLRLSRRDQPGIDDDVEREEFVPTLPQVDLLPQQVERNHRGLALREREGDEHAGLEEVGARVRAGRVREAALRALNTFEAFAGPLPGWEGKPSKKKLIVSRPLMNKQMIHLI